MEGKLDWFDVIRMILLIFKKKKVKKRKLDILRAAVPSSSQIVADFPVHAEKHKKKPATTTAPQSPPLF